MRKFIDYIIVENCIICDKELYIPDNFTQDIIMCEGCRHRIKNLLYSENEAVDFPVIETPNCSECEHYEEHHASLACAKCPVITKSWGSNYGID